MDQLSYISSLENYPIQYITIPGKLKEQARLNPDTEIFIFYSTDGTRTSVTFYELYRESQHFSQILKSLGIQKGDKVIIHLYNSIEWLIVSFGLMSIGAVPVGVYIVRNDASDINYVAEKTEAVAIFFTSPSIEIRETIKRLVEKGSPKLKCAVCIDIDKDDGNLLSYNKLLKMATNIASDIILDPDDIIMIMRSSGTTGYPKLVSHSHLSLQKVFNDLFREVVPIAYTNMQFSWLGGSPVANIFSSVPKVTISGIPSITTVNHLELIEKESCPALFLTVDVLNCIIRDNLCLPPCVKIIFLGGTTMKRKFNILLDYVNCLHCAYGSLEMGMVASFRVEKGMKLEDNVGGHVVPGVEIKIADELNQTVIRGTKGRIFVRRCNSFRGYFGDEEMTKRVVHPSGWHDTGDVGYISENNKLFVIGRDGDCVNRGSVTIHATEIENTLMNLNLPEIQDIVVVPVPDEINNEEVCACVILKNGHSVTPGDLLRKIGEKMTLYRPKYVVVMKYFPTNINGKVMRKQIARQATHILEENKQELSI